MTRDQDQRELRDRVERQARRLRRAERERYQWLTQTLYLGSLGLAFVLPVVIGAYLGSWLDRHLEGYSTSWTLSLIFVGLVVGAFNLYFMLRE